MIDERVRTALKNDIAAKLLAGGPKGWREIQSRYPQVSPATFFRLVGQVKAKRAEEADELYSEPPTGGEIIVSGISREVSKWSSGGTERPISLSAEKLFAEIASLFDDANLLRNYALDSHGKIKAPTAFVESVKLRDRAIRVAVGMFAEIHLANFADDFADAIFEAVAVVDLATAKQIMLAVHEIQTRNFTPKPKIERSTFNDRDSAS
jgi:hypothetical protein